MSVFEEGMRAARRRTKEDRAGIWRRLFLAGVGFHTIARAWRVRPSTVENTMRRTLKVKS